MVEVMESRLHGLQNHPGNRRLNYPLNVPNGVVFAALCRACKTYGTSRNRWDISRDRFPGVVSN